jgi:hypothetical protein
MRPGLTRAAQIFGRTLALAHADFGRLLRHRHVREHADPHAALRFMWRVIARRAASIWRAVTRSGSIAFRPKRTEVQSGAALGVAVDAALELPCGTLFSSVAA